MINKHNMINNFRCGYGHLITNKVVRKRPVNLAAHRADNLKLLRYLFGFVQVQLPTLPAPLSKTVIQHFGRQHATQNSTEKKCDKALQTLKPGEKP